MDLCRVVASDLKNLPRFRHLVRNLVVKDLHIKYRSSILGYCWSLLNPLVVILTYIVAFKYFLGIGISAGVEYVLFLVIGIVFWNFFSEIITHSADAIVENRNLIEKIQFPRITLVLSSHLFCLVQHVLVYPLLALLIFLYYRSPLTYNLLWLLPVLILFNLFLLGMGLFFSCVTVFFRDMKHFIELGLKILFWFTPIVYPLTRIPEEYVFFIKATPLTPFIRCIQRLLLSGEAPSAYVLLQAVVYSASALVLGGVTFYCYQHRFVEEI